VNTFLGGEKGEDSRNRKLDSGDNLYGDKEKKGAADNWNAEPVKLFLGPVLSIWKKRGDFLGMGKPTEFHEEIRGIEKKTHGNNGKVSASIRRPGTARGAKL